MVTRAAGRPRSEAARTAVLHAVDDLLVEVGYAGVTMKGVAARAGVSRQTVYRWWSTTAEILLEASAVDAEDELAVPRTTSLVDDLEAFLRALVVFLTRSAAGAAYRALLGEAQHDPAVAGLIATHDPIGHSARRVLDHPDRPDLDPLTLDQATALLVGPVFYAVLTGQDLADADLRGRAEAFLAEATAQARAVGQGWAARSSSPR